MRTPIELLIYQLQYRYNVDPNPVLMIAIETATSMLGLERSHLETTYLEGRIDESHKKQIDPEEFFIAKYTKP
jgi:hypothetical protein